jgi:AGCS family alanine or glycine:cation symporter
MQDLGTVFAFADVAMGLLALVNLIALVLLFKVGLRLMDDYDGQRAAGNPQPLFDASKFPDLDLDHAAWRDVGSREAGVQARPGDAAPVRTAI